MITFPENIYSEQPAIKLLQRLGYQYLDGESYDNREGIDVFVLEQRLRAAIQRLNPWISDNNLQKAYDKITSIQGNSLMEINQQAWELMRAATFSVKQKIAGEENFHPVRYIDYKEPENNHFLVVNQMKFHGRYQNSIPDLVIFLNGLPIAVIECKSPKAQGAWDKAFGDLQYYQENSEKLFHYNQICAGIWGVGARYGAINAPRNYYSVFKAELTEIDEEVLGQKASAQDLLLYHLFSKKRLLDIIRHFVIFELEEGTTVKKLPRYQQIRATNQTIEKLQTGEGGVVWHTQGSGKSITMAYVARKLQAPEFGFDNPTILIMTDRKDLDRQITTTFRNTGFKNVQQASSVEHLDRLLRNDYGGIITTTLQKFQEADKAATDQEDQTEEEEHDFIKIEKHITDKLLVKVTKVLENGRWVEWKREEIALEELSQKENLYVLVDEAHRSHYGFLASFMRTVLPHAKFVAFTGTPISKDEKSTLGEFYGGEYIDVYTIIQSVADGATVELLYDEGIAQLDVKKEALDLEFAEKFGHLPAEKQDKLKREALRKYQFSLERMETIARHIIDHYQNKIFPDGHKAILVCDGRFQAKRYKEILDQLAAEGLHNFSSKLIITLGSPKSDEIAKEYAGVKKWNERHPNDPKPNIFTAPEKIKDAAEDFKLPFGDEDELNVSGLKQFDNTAFLIVSDMLLTGYDVPIASCLYLDKPLIEHNLLQAIARVNRSRKGKKAGFIVDYYGITAHLVEAMEIFSGDIRVDDILKNINEEIPYLKLNHTKLVDFFKPMRIDRNYERDRFVDTAIQFLEPINRRDEFKDLLRQFNKSLNIVLPNTAAMPYRSDFKLFNELKIQARNAFPEDLDLKISVEESKMLQAMIDEHLKAQGIKNLLEEPVSIIDTERLKREMRNDSAGTQELKMRNKLKHTIKVGLDKNPDFYKPLAQRLEELLQLKAERRIDETQLLLGYADIQQMVAQQQEESQEKGFTTDRQQAIYTSMKLLFEEDAENATKTLFDLINGELNIIGWKGKGKVLKAIERKLTRFLQSKLERSEAKAKALELIGVLRENT